MFIIATASRYRRQGKTFDSCACVTITIHKQVKVRVEFAILRYGDTLCVDGVCNLHLMEPPARHTLTVGQLCKQEAPRIRNIIDNCKTYQPTYATVSQLLYPHFGVSRAQRPRMPPEFSIDGNEHPRFAVTIPALGAAAFSLFVCLHHRTQQIQTPSNANFFT
jgi:hypothetical protein